MNLIDTSKISSIEEALRFVSTLQTRLIGCEQCLDDLARSVEISIAVRQPDIPINFVETANEFLKDRINVIPETIDEMNITVITDEESQS